MTTHTDKDTAITAGLASDKAQTTLQIVLADGTTAFINVTCAESVFRGACRKSPMPAIKAIIGAVADLRDLRAKAREAARTPADRAFDAVIVARAKAEAAEHASYYDPAKICSLRNAADKAHAEWRASYPAEAAEADAKAAAARQAREDEIKSRPGYIAALEGRD